MENAPTTTKIALLSQYLSTTCKICFVKVLCYKVFQNFEFLAQKLLFLKPHFFIFMFLPTMLLSEVPQHKVVGQGPPEIFWNAVQRYFYMLVLKCLRGFSLAIMVGNRCKKTARGPNKTHKKINLRPIYCILNHLVRFI